MYSRDTLGIKGKRVEQNSLRIEITSTRLQQQFIPVLFEIIVQMCMNFGLDDSLRDLGVKHS